MKYLLILFILFVGLDAQIQKHHLSVVKKRVASAACASESIDQEFDDGDTWKSLGVLAYGQDFQVSTNGNLSIISIYLSHTADGTISLRWGTGSDLTTIYDEEVTSPTITVTPAGNWYDFELTNKTEVTTGTSYYFAVIENSGTFDWHEEQGSATYAFGMYRYSSTTMWNLNGSNSARDFRFRVYLCD